jgi:hypothetical protein
MKWLFGSLALCISLAGYAEGVAAGERRETLSTEDSQEEALSFNDYPPIYFSNASYSLAAVSALGDSLQLHDGSLWRVNPYDGNKALSWRLSDVLMVTQNGRWFSSYQYRLINKSTGASIEANLDYGPPLDGAFTRFVRNLDGQQRIVELTDGSVWQVLDSDVERFRKWMEGDEVLAGFNSGWGIGYDYILINVQLDAFVRARPY